MFFLKRKLNRTKLDVTVPLCEKGVGCTILQNYLFPKTNWQDKFFGILPNNLALILQINMRFTITKITEYASSLS